MNRYLIIFFAFLPLNIFAQTSWDPNSITAKLKLVKFTASIDSMIYSNETLKGKTVYINFWYASCPPCVAEFDALNTMYNKLKGKSNFEFLSFTFEDSDVIEMFIDKFKIKYPILHMPKDDIKKLSLGKGYPTSMVVDSQGNISYLRIGADSDKKEARKIIMGEVYPAILKSL